MTNEQKRALARILIQQAGNIVEMWEESKGQGYDEEVLRDVNSWDAGVQLAVWLKDLPGDDWDTRLPCVAKATPITGKTVVSK